jgi:hypothetical protein
MFDRVNAQKRQHPMYARDETPFRSLTHAVLGCAAAVFLFIQAANMQARHRRLAANPHSTGQIVRTWVTYGKGGGRFADLTFTSAGDNRRLECRAAAVRIGPSTLSASPGQSIDLVPIPGDCSPPDVPTQSSPDYLIWMLYGSSFVFGTIGLMKLTATPMLSARTTM